MRKALFLAALSTVLVAALLLGRFREGFGVDGCMYHQLWYDENCVEPTPVEEEPPESPFDLGCERIHQVPWKGRCIDPEETDVLPYSSDDNDNLSHVRSVLTDSGAVVDLFPDKEFVRPDKTFKTVDSTVRMRPDSERADVVVRVVDPVTEKAYHYFLDGNGSLTAEPHSVPLSKIRD